MNKTILDIGTESWPSAALSNFSAHSFVFRGVHCASMEGLLQSFKFSCSKKQVEVCALVGRKAKFKGKKKKWFLTQTLFWEGIAIGRHSEEFQIILDEAFESLFDQSNDAQRALMATGHAVLTHSMGKTDANFTVLTVEEFVSRLMRIRAKLASLQPVEPTLPCS